MEYNVQNTFKPIDFSSYTPLDKRSECFMHRITLDQIFKPHITQEYVNRSG
ncbi:phosphohydrolase, partial [Bacillus paranthracis]|nr:phosphohydrolase [Bacillus paranthracis]